MDDTLISLHNLHVVSVLTGHVLCFLEDELFAAVAHEIGHSLGLTHSANNLSVMHPVFKNSSPEYTILLPEDIQGINFLDRIHAS